MAEVDAESGSEAAEAKPVIELTDKQNLQSLCLERLIDWATINCRSGRSQCDTARFASRKIGGVVVPRVIGGVKVERSLSWEGALSIADRFRACSGSSNGMCHFPPAPRE